MNTQQEHTAKVKEEHPEESTTKQEKLEENNAHEASSDKKLIAAQKELEAQLLRLQADFDNYQKRTLKREAEFLSRANEQLLKKIVPIVNDLERALNAQNVKNEDDTLKGVKMIHEKLLQALAKEGIEPIQLEEGSPIQDDEQVEAISSIEVAEEKQKGTIIQIIERGYLYKGKPLLRTKVIVGR